MESNKTIDNNFNKVNTKKELLSLLKEYSGILNYAMIDYLKSLIDLEFSIIKDYISKDVRKALSELEIYKKIAIYNIYNKALELFECQNDNFSYYGNNEGNEGLTIYANIENSKIKLFEFTYREKSNSLNKDIPDGYKTMRIGDISIFRTFKILREEEMNRVLRRLEILYDEKNPYCYSKRSGIFEGPASIWEFEHAKKIEKYEKKFEELDRRKELTDIDQIEIEITEKYHSLLLEEYGLSNINIEDDINIFEMDKSELNKTLIKEMPNITISDNFKFLIDN